MNQENPTTPQAPSTSVTRPEAHDQTQNHRRAPDRKNIRISQEKQALLRARAKALAQAPESNAAGSLGRAAATTIDVITFRLAHETYAVESHYVREIVPHRALTPVPCTPTFVLGVINVRGQIFSVIDLKEFFALPSQGLIDLNKLILLHTQSMALAVSVDAILDVRQVRRDALQPALPTLTGMHAEFLKGIAAGGLIVLDTGKLLSNRAIIVREEVEA